MNLFFVAFEINCVSEVDAKLCAFIVGMSMNRFHTWQDDKSIGKRRCANIANGDDRGLCDPDIILSDEINLKAMSNITRVTGDWLFGRRSEGGNTAPRNFVSLFLLSMNLKSFK